MNAIDKAMEQLQILIDGYGYSSYLDEAEKDNDYDICKARQVLDELKDMQANTVCISRQELEAMRKNPDNHQHMQTGGGRYTYTLGFNDCIDKLLNKQEDGE